MLAGIIGIAVAVIAIVLYAFSRARTMDDRARENQLDEKGDYNDSKGIPTASKGPEWSDNK